MTKLKVGVCECPAEMTVESPDWSRLCELVAREAPHLFLLNEMPFGPWIAAGDRFDQRVWRESLAAHNAGMARLGDLGAKIVAGTRPRELNGRRVNEAFIAGRAVHTKQYFPDEEGFYEARWFQAGDRHFLLADAGPLRCGFLICTELMFNEHARHYGRIGADVILVPRATGTSLDRWLVATRMAAIVSGSYVISSNRGGGSFGGSGWIVDPRGDLVARTSAESPVAFYEIDTDVVAQAQREYPCYVPE